MGFAQWSDHLPIFYFLQSTLESEIQTQDQEITQQKSKIDQKANTVSLKIILKLITFGGATPDYVPIFYLFQITLEEKFSKCVQTTTFNTKVKDLQENIVSLQFYELMSMV